MADCSRWLPVTACLVWIVLLLSVNADDIDSRARRGNVIKILREMANKTKADSLDLPANATSIRENITDTFKCENRTYGYYADVDNECQVFHVCLTRQASSGRNVTYRWSFICPNETIFNQEVLTCTRPRDSIDCEDSPMYYHLNMEIGKETNETQTNDSPNTGNTTKNNRRTPIKKQNLIVDKLNEVIDKEYDKVMVENFAETPIVKEMVRDVNEEYEMEGKRMENARLAAERSLRRKGRTYRGSFRFKADV